MENEDEEAKKKKPITAKGFKDLIRALDSEASHTSFGILPLSVENTAPIYSFPHAKKDDGEKIFISEEMARNANAAKHSPGPAYTYEDMIKFGNAPNFGFGTASKMAPLKPKYDFYENDRFIDDPIEADHTRKPRCAAPKIGTEPRMQNLNAFEKTPGPQYFPQEKPNMKTSEKYSFGYRRTKGAQDSLINKASTTKSVGPGRYVPESWVNPSTRKDYPKWTLPKAGRAGTAYKRLDRNQTYDTRSAFSRQHLSKNKTGSWAHFGTSGRSSKVGAFRDSMTGHMKVRMPHVPY